jgi:hypothetical protein
MTNTLKRKLDWKIVLLAVLSAALLFLRTPTPVQAQQGTQCMKQCLSQFKACVASCNGNKACIQNCSEINQECEAGCIP